MTTFRIDTIEDKSVLKKPLIFVEWWHGGGGGISGIITLITHSTLTVLYIEITQP